MGDLTKDFNKSEFVCKHCGRIRINIKLVNALQKLRDNVNKPIKINSAYRCLDHNRSIGSDDTSQHIKGNAADIVIKGLTPKEVAKIAETIPVFKDGGIGIYKTFTHVDVRSNGPARWTL